MRVDSVLLLVLMVLKLIAVVPMAFENMGAGYAMGCFLLTVAGYGSLVYFSERESRTGGKANA